MTMTRLKTLLGSATLIAGLTGVSAANAESLDAIMQVGTDLTSDAAASQVKIDRLLMKPVTCSLTIRQS